MKNSKKEAWMSVFEDEYEGNLYTQCRYRCGTLSDRWDIDKDLAEALGPKKHNKAEAPIFVRCDSCNEYMDFVTGNNGWADNKWICPVCHTEVTEKEVYTETDLMDEIDLFDEEEEL